MKKIDLHLRLAYLSQNHNSPQLTVSICISIYNNAFGSPMKQNGPANPLRGAAIVWDILSRYPDLHMCCSATLLRLNRMQNCRGSFPFLLNMESPSNVCG
jgi:hypothetical protein